MRSKSAQTTKDPYRLLDAAYSFETDEHVWLERLVEELAPYDLGGGMAIYTSELGPAVRVRSVVNRTHLPDAALREMTRILPPAFYRRLHAPNPLRFSAQAFPDDARNLDVDPSVWLFDHPDFTPRAAWAVSGGDANVATALAVFHCVDGQAHSLKDRRALDCLGAHLGSALRLRSVLQHPPTADEAAAELVVDSSGRVLHARGEVTDQSTRTPLLDAIRRSERAKLRAASPEERLEVWTALVQGQWSILENTEGDGKRLLLAYRNDPLASPMRGLSAREQAVVSYAALGHSFKYIAYELGIAVSTAAACLKRALRKLGLTSRAELIRLIARQQPTPTERC